MPLYPRPTHGRPSPLEQKGKGKEEGTFGHAMSFICPLGVLAIVCCIRQWEGWWKHSQEKQASDRMGS